MKISIIALTSALLLALGASAQNYRLPDRHQSQHFIYGLRSNPVCDEN